MKEVSTHERSPLNANPAKWSNTLKQFVGNLPTNCLSVFDHFVKLTLKGLILCDLVRYSVFIFCSNEGRIPGAS